MKTTKLTAIAIAFVFAATATMAQRDYRTDRAEPDPIAINMQLKKALQDKAIVFAMRTQLSPEFLKVEKPRYTVPVKLPKRVLYVTGTYDEWCYFFNIDIGSPDKGIKGNRMHLKEAMHNSMLAKSMHEQLTPDFLRDDKAVYTAVVKYKWDLIYVFGTLDEWQQFFRFNSNDEPLGD